MGAEDLDPAAGRLFIAIELSDYVIEAIRGLHDEAARAKGLNWIPPEKLHLTLAFLGEVDPDVQQKIFRRLPEIKVEPFFLALQGLDVFPRKGRPQVLWAGMAPADPRLFQLHGKVERVLMDLGFEPERRRYRPHVTIARCGARAEPATAGLLKKHADFGTAPFRVDGIALYASEPGPRAAVYRKLMEVRFGE